VFVGLNNVIVVSLQEEAVVTLIVPLKDKVRTVIEEKDLAFVNQDVLLFMSATRVLPDEPMHHVFKMEFLELVTLQTNA